VLQVQLGRAVVKSLLVAGAAVAIVACAAAGSQKAMTPAPASVQGAPRPQTMPTDPHPDDPSHQEITRLASEIDQDSTTLGVPASAHAMSAPVAPVAPDHDLACAPTGTKCTQSCTLSSTICSNAEQICKLADKLAGDEWAQQKCGDARKTCGDANKVCCECAP